MLTYQVLRGRYEDLKKSHIELFDELFRTDKENKHLNKQLDQALKELDEFQQRIEKLKAYLGNCDWNNKDFEKLYDIATGSDEE